MDTSHRDALDDATAPDEQWTTLAGHLYDPAREKQACPDGMAEAIADSYALTSEGRLFYLRADGGVTERSSHNGRFQITADGQRWSPSIRALLKLVFPSEVEVDAPDSRDEWLKRYEGDELDDLLGPLAEKSQPDDAHIVQRDLSEMTA
jgi:hypothetical protein